MVLLSVFVTGSAFAADVFYETRLRAGREALAAGKHLDAVENLRIACFGMLDAPRALSPCLMMLAVSQNALNRASDVDATLSRFIEVETRFPSYDVSQLEPAVRREFETLIQARIPKGAVAALPAVNAALTGTRYSPATATRSEPAPVRSEPARTEPPRSEPARSTPPPVVENVTVLPMPKPAPVQPVAATASAPVTQKPTPPPATTKPAPAQSKPVVQSSPVKPQASAASPKPAVVAPTKPAPARVSADPIGDAKKLMADRRAGEAVKVLEAAIVQSPQRRDLRLAHLQAAVFASDWKSAVAQQQALRPFRESEAAYTFYGAVALYESGRRGEARDLLSPVMPRLARSAWVDDYAKRILSSK